MTRPLFHLFNHFDFRNSHTKIRIFKECVGEWVVGIYTPTQMEGLSNYGLFFLQTQLE